MGLGALWADFKDDLFTYRTVKVRLYRARAFSTKRQRERVIPRSLFSRDGVHLESPRAFLSFFLSLFLSSLARSIPDIVFVF